MERINISQQPRPITQSPSSRHSPYPCLWSLEILPRRRRRKFKVTGLVTGRLTSTGARSNKQNSIYPWHGFRELFNLVKHSQVWLTMFDTSRIRSTSRHNWYIPLSVGIPKARQCSIKSLLGAKSHHGYWNLAHRRGGQSMTVGDVLHVYVIRRRIINLNILIQVLEKRSNEANYLFTC